MQLHRRGRLTRLLAVLALVGLIAAACGSDDDDDAADDGGDGGSEETATFGPDSDDFVAMSGVPGVTDTEIRFGLLGTGANNPLGTCYLKCFRQGVEAYFAWRNSEGGLFGRELVVSEELDDETGKHQQRAIELIGSDEVFSAFSIGLIPTGWPEFEKAGWPVYTYITDHVLGRQDNIFGAYAIAASNIPRIDQTLAAISTGSTKIGSIGYGVAESSKQCADQVELTVDKYADVSDAEFVYKNSDLPFGLANGVGPEVTAMKEAGVDMLFTCLELNGLKTFALEMQRQDADIRMVHYAGFDADFFEENAALFEGDVVGTHFRPVQGEPTPAQANYEKWLNETGVEERVEVMLHAWIAADIAYEGMKKAGAPLDRKEVIDATNTIEDYTADGLKTPTDIGRHHQPASLEDPAEHGETPFCYSYFEIKGGKAELLEPMTAELPFACWPGDTYEWSEPEATSFE